MLDDYRDVIRDQRSVVDRVSFSVKFFELVFDYYRYVINFQEQGNGCYLIKMMSIMGYLFFFLEVNVRII